MYKKITHTIVEEHFDHPIAGQIKKSLDKKKTITNEIFSESKFRSDILSYFERYKTGLFDLIDTSTGTDDQFLTAFDNLFRSAWIDEIGNIMDAIYPTEFGERLNESMRVLASSLFLSLQSLKMGKDTANNFNRMSFFTNDLSGNLGNFNTSWGFQIVNPLLTSLVADLMNQAKGKTSKNSALEQQSRQKVSVAFDSLATALIDGTINKHAERFNKSTLAPSFNDRDLM